MKELVKELNLYKKVNEQDLIKTKQAGNVPFKVLKTGGDTQEQRCYQIILLDERFEKKSS